MNRSFVLAAAFALALPAAGAIGAAPAAAATTVHVHKHGGVSVHHSRPAPRAHQFHWRGKWVARVHGSRFVWPHGQRYRHWTVGARLPLAFVGSSYYYDGYASLGFSAPPTGYRWVRYGDDLVLVNLRTGEIEDISYGVFE